MPRRQKFSTPVSVTNGSIVSPFPARASPNISKPPQTKERPRFKSGSSTPNARRKQSSAQLDGRSNQRTTPQRKQPKTAQTGDKVVDDDSGAGERAETPGPSPSPTKAAAADGGAAPAPHNPRKQQHRNRKSRREEHTTTAPAAAEAAADPFPAAPAATPQQQQQQQQANPGTIGRSTRRKRNNNKNNNNKRRSRQRSEYTRGGGGGQHRTSPGKRGGPAAATAAAAVDLTNSDGTNTASDGDSAGPPSVGDTATTTPVIRPAAHTATAAAAAAAAVSPAADSIPADPAIVHVGRHSGNTPADLRSGSIFFLDAQLSSPLYVVRDSPSSPARPAVPHHAQLVSRVSVGSDRPSPAIERGDSSLSLSRLGLNFDAPEFHPKSGATTAAVSPFFASPTTTHPTRASSVRPSYPASPAVATAATGPAHFAILTPPAVRFASTPSRTPAAQETARSLSSAAASPTALTRERPGAPIFPRAPPPPPQPQRHGSSTEHSPCGSSLSTKLLGAATTATTAASASATRNDVDNVRHTRVAVPDNVSEEGMFHLLNADDDDEHHHEHLPRAVSAPTMVLDARQGHSPTGSAAQAKTPGSYVAGKAPQPLQQRPGSSVALDDEEEEIFLERSAGPPRGARSGGAPAGAMGGSGNVDEWDTRSVASTMASAPFSAEKGGGYWGTEGPRASLNLFTMWTAAGGGGAALASPPHLMHHHPSSPDAAFPDAVPHGDDNFGPTYHEHTTAQHFDFVDETDMMANYEDFWEVASSAYETDSLDEAQTMWIEEQLKASENPEGFFPF